MDGCGPCTRLKQEIHSHTYVKYVSSRDPASEKYGCDGFPTIVIEREGRIVHKQAGAMSESDFVRTWQKYDS